MISFVIPTLNEEKTIEATLQSLDSFSGPHEVIISDGGSTDRTVEICRRYTDKIVIYDKPERQTIAMARNMGADVATGDYVVFVDADVVIPDIDDFFGVAGEAFGAEPRLVALTVKYRVFPDQRTWADAYMFFALGVQFRVQNNLLRTGASGGEFQMIDAEAFRKVNGFDEKLTAAEDMDLFKRLSKIGRTRFENKLTVFHTGRRAHAIGWRKLSWQWFSNSMSVSLFKKSASKEWTEIR
ncbi:glycosyltransferase involved in cell wall biosynthesis [Mycobacterium sp. MAA66]|uniref:glycosyltransferase n=1 Tax=Mycobacterium sp. MAA66 TaxID=3156297 RepID=UPI0035132709